MLLVFVTSGKKTIKNGLFFADWFLYLDCGEYTVSFETCVAMFSRYIKLFYFKKV